MKYNFRIVCFPTQHGYNYILICVKMVKLATQTIRIEILPQSSRLG